MTYDVFYSFYFQRVFVFIKVFSNKIICNRNVSSVSVQMITEISVAEIIIILQLLTLDSK